MSDNSFEDSEYEEEANYDLKNIRKELHSFEKIMNIILEKITSLEKATIDMNEGVRVYFNELRTDVNELKLALSSSSAKPTPKTGSRRGTTMPSKPIHYKRAADYYAWKNSEDPEIRNSIDFKNILEEVKKTAAIKKKFKTEFASFNAEQKDKITKEMNEAYKNNIEAIEKDKQVQELNKIHAHPPPGPPSDLESDDSEPKPKKTRKKPAQKTIKASAETDRKPKGKKRTTKKVSSDGESE